MSARSGSVHGYEIHSDLPLTRLRRGPGARGTIAVRRTREPLDGDGAELLQLTRDPADGRAVMRVERFGEALNVWCREIGSARVDPHAATITWAGSAAGDAFEDRLVNLLVPVLIAARGELVVHGAAIETPAGAVIACGPSGRGKSTFAAVLAARGARVLAEDAVAISVGDDGCRVWPGPVGIRLRRGGAHALFTVDADAGAADVRGKRLHLRAHALDGDATPVPLHAIVVLEPRAGTEPRLSALRADRAVAHIFPSLFRLGGDRGQALLPAIAELVAHVDCHLLRLPDDLDAAGRHVPEVLGRVSRRAVRPAA